MIRYNSFFPTGRKRSEPLSLPLYELLISSIIQHFHRSASSVDDLEQKLHDLGQDAGSRLIEIHYLREKSGKREVHLLPLLLTIQTVFWKEFFGTPADSLERSLENEGEFMIIEKKPVLFKNTFLPKDLVSFNPCAWTAGILQSIITSSGFKCTVTAHRSCNEITESVDNIVYLVQADSSLMTQGLIE